MKIAGLPGNWSMVHGGVERCTYEAHLDDEEAALVVEGVTVRVRSVSTPVAAGRSNGWAPAGIAVTGRYVVIEKFRLLPRVWRIRLALRQPS